MTPKLEVSWSSEYLEAQDDGPDEPETEAGVTVYDVVRAHVLQVYSLFSQKLQGFVNVLQAVNTHLALRRPWLHTQTHRFSISDGRY